MTALNVLHRQVIRCGEAGVGGSLGMFCDRHAVDWDIDRHECSVIGSAVRAGYWAGAAVTRHGIARQAGSFASSLHEPAGGES